MAISKCGNLFWGGPVYEVTDPAGNKYLQHARLSPASPPPTAALLPPYWTITQIAGGKKITTLNNNMMCAADMADGSALRNGNFGTTGCLMVILTDAAGNGYHRYVWTNKEMVQFPGPPAQLSGTFRPDKCKAACKFQAFAAPAFSGKIVRTFLGGPSAFSVTLKRTSARVSKYEQPLPDGSDPEGKLKNKGFMRGPVGTDQNFADFLTGALSRLGTVRGALVVRALSYKVYDSVSDQSLATATSDDNILNTTAAEQADDPDNGAPPAALESGETPDDPPTVQADVSANIAFKPKVLPIAITSASYNNVTRKLKVTITTDANTTLQTMLKKILDVEVSSAPDPLLLKRKLWLYKPILWAIDKP